MDAKKYLQKAYCLDERLGSLIYESLKHHRTVKMLETAMGMQLGASLTCTLEKLWDLESEINMEVDALVTLKREVRAVIGKVPSAAERLVLRLRYIHGMDWEEISGLVGRPVETVKVWHEKGLAHVKVPKESLYTRKEKQA